MPTSPLGGVTFHYRKPVRGSLIWWLRCLGIVAFLILLWRLPQSHQVRLEHIDLRWVGLCMLLTLLQLLLETLTWQWLLSTQHIPHPYPKTLVAYLSSQYLGLVTPGHVGEFLAAGYISMNTGITFGYALSSVVMKKLLSWVMIVGFGLWGLPLLNTVPFLRGVEKIAWTSAVVVAVLVVAIGIWVVSLRRLARKWQRLSPWQIDMTEFRSGMRHLFGFRLLGPLALAACSFSLLFLQLHVVLKALGVGLPLLLVARIVALSRIAARIVPFSVIGFGSKDAAVILMLAQQGIDASGGITAALLWLVCSYLLTLVLSGVCWWAKPLIVRRAQTPS